jgi:carboxypeptidase C (cathepsin A)
MKAPRLAWVVVAVTIACGAAAAGPATKEKAEEPEKAADSDKSEAPKHLRDAFQRTAQSLSAGGRTLTYQAEAGVLVVHTKDPLDEEPPAPASEHGAAAATASAEASLSYVAYFLGREPDPRRPITFLFNGGPGSSTVWLHMGSFGPKRVLAHDAGHGPAAPYRLVDNTYTLLPDSDLVFVDAPGTGFGHLRGPDREKAFFGVDQDAQAFANFITEFLSRHGRWNSPKYVFGESYGTMRAGALAYVLQNEGIDLNGVILLSQWLAADDNADSPQFNPGADQPYVESLPTYATPQPPGTTRSCRPSRPRWSRSWPRSSSSPSAITSRHSPPATSSSPHGARRSFNDCMHTRGYRPSISNART